MTKDEYFSKSEDLAERIKRLKVERWRRLNRPLEFTESQPEEQLSNLAIMIKDLEDKSWALMSEYIKGPMR